MRMAPFQASTLILGCILLPLPAFAEEHGVDAFFQDEVNPDHGGLDLGIEFGVEWIHEYWWRGYVSETAGIMLQPWLEVSFPLRDAKAEGGPSIDAYIGTWHSFHSKDTSSTGRSLNSWFEADLYAGVTFGFDTVVFGAEYVVFFYPNNDDSNIVQELGLTVRFDLENEGGIGFLIGDPTFGFYHETKNSNVGNGVDEASYFEVAFGPTFEVFDGRAELSFPMLLGLSLDDFYVDDAGDDDTFGFFSIGADLGFSLGTDDGGGEWYLNLGAKAFILGKNTESFNNGDHVDAYGYVGLSYAF